MKSMLQRGFFWVEWSCSERFSGAQPLCPWLDTQGELKWTQEDTDNLKMSNI